jgi:hypothetical protein
MTDQSQITAIESQLTALAAGTTTLSVVETSLGELWNQAETAGDQHALTLISTAWEHAQALAAVTEQAAGLALSAVEVAGEAVRQRDTIAEEYGKVATEHEALLTAVKKADTTNPLIDQLYDDLYDSAQESVYEYISEMQQYSDGIHTDAPGEEIVSNGHLPGLDDPEIAQDFAYIVMGYSDNLPDEMLTELSAFAQGFTARANAWWDAEQARRREEYLARQSKVTGNGQ